MKVDTKALERREFFTYHEMSAQKKEELLEMLKKALESKEEVKLAVIHGSFLSNGPFRDIDLAVYIAGSDPLDTLLNLRVELSELLDLHVDVRMINQAPAWFIRKVLGSCIILVNKQPYLMEGLLKSALEWEWRTKNSA